MYLQIPEAFLLKTTLVYLRYRRPPDDTGVPPDDTGVPPEDTGGAPGPDGDGTTPETGGTPPAGDEPEPEPGAGEPEPEDGGAGGGGMLTGAPSQVAVPTGGLMLQQAQMILPPKKDYMAALDGLLSELYKGTV